MAASQVKPDCQAQGRNSLVLSTAFGEELIAVGKCLFKVLASVDVALLLQHQHTKIVEQLVES